MLSKLQKILNEQKIDFFLLPNADEFFLEYLPESEKRIEFLTGFTGSNAMVIIGQEKAFFFTDGRYTLQAAQQLNKQYFEIFNIAEKSPLAWLKENLQASQVLAIGAKISSINFVKQCQEISQQAKAVLHFTAKNPVDEIWSNRPVKTNSPIYFCDEALFGATSFEKRARILEKVSADILLITKPENLCWLLNLRAADIEFTPLLVAYAILFKTGEIEVFADPARLGRSDLADPTETFRTGQNAPSGTDSSSDSLNLSDKKIKFRPEAEFENRLGELQNSVYSRSDLADPTETFRAGQNAPSGNESGAEFKTLSKIGSSIESDSKLKIQTDPTTTNQYLFDLLSKNSFALELKTDPIDLAKSIKNSAEIAAIKKAHEIDGVAVTQFISWLKKSVTAGQKIDEISAQEKLLEFRQKNPAFLFPSFASISGFAENGAVIHYRASEQTNKIIQGNSLYLIDSGGQYLGEGISGTTDITRTIAIGKPTPEMIENFTRVLKGHIAIARVKFPRGTTGAQLDVLARFHLWQAGLDYDHGTGHGVGNFMSVHEGPCGISKRAHQELLPGMILSNEPGYYKPGEYGIRIENLMLVKELNDKFLHFETLTKAPIDLELVDMKMLTYPEKKWLTEYNQNCNITS